MTTDTPTTSGVRPVLLGALVGAVVLGGAFAGGVRYADAQHAVALAASQRTSDSLRVALRDELASVRRDTAWRDSVVVRWRVKRAKVETLPPVIAPARVETVTVAAEPRVAVPLATLQLADSAIEGLDRAHRRCLSVLTTCEATQLALTNRAERAEAHAARLEAAAGRVARFRAFERGLCVASVGFNVFQWQSARRDR